MNFDILNELCYECNNNIHNKKFRGIKCTFLCPKCCNHAIFDSLCTQKYAILHKISHTNLYKRLSYVYKTENHFITKEIDILLILLDQEREVLKHNRSKKLEDELEARYKKIEYDTRKVPLDLHEYVFGNYLFLVRDTKSKTKFSHVKKALFFLPTTLNACQILNIHKSREIVLDFAVKHKITDVDQLVERYKTHQGLFNRILDLEQDRIMSFICYDDIKNTASIITPLKKRWETHDTILCDKLKQKLLYYKIFESDIDYLLKSSATKKRVQRYKKYLLNIDDTAQKLIHFLKTRHDKELREENLKSVLQQWNVPFRSDSMYSYAYVHGDIDIDVDEVTAVMFLTRKLFKISRKYFEKNSEKLHKFFEINRFVYGLSCKKACEKALNDLKYNALSDSDTE